MAEANLRVNPYDSYVYKAYDDPQVYEVFAPGNHIRYYYTESKGTLFNTISPSFNSKVRTRSIDKIAKRASAGMSANLAQDLAQFNQLTRLIGDNARRLAGSIQHLANKQFYLAALSLYADPTQSRAAQRKLSTTRAVSENWLALQYGWKPLLDDIHGLFETLVNGYVKGTHVYKVRALSRSWRDDKLFRQSLITGSPARTTTEVTQLQECRIVLRYRVRSQLTNFLAQTGFLNPINLAWEVLPYSFVIDWLLPIGPWLESMSNFLGCEFIDGSLVEECKLWQSGSYDETFRATDNGLLEHRAGSFDQYERAYHRERLDSWPRPDIPTFKDPASFLHMANGLALLGASKRYFV